MASRSFLLLDAQLESFLLLDAQLERLDRREERLRRGPQTRARLRALVGLERQRAALQRRAVYVAFLLELSSRDTLELRGEA